RRRVAARRHRRHNFVVGVAAAEVPHQFPAQLHLISRGIALQSRIRGYSKAGCTKAALSPIMAHKRLQYPAKIGLLCQPLDGDDRAPADLHGQKMASVYWLSVQQDRASPTLATVAGALGPGQIGMVAEDLEERRAVVNLKALLLPIDCYIH